MIFAFQLDQKSRQCKNLIFVELTVQFAETAAHRLVTIVLRFMVSSSSAAAADVAFDQIGVGLQVGSECERHQRKRGEGLRPARVGASRPAQAGIASVILPRRHPSFSCNGANV